METRGGKARLLMVLSAVIFGTVGFAVRGIGLPSAEIALYRALMAAALVGLFLLVTRSRIPLREAKREIPLLLLSGAAMGINWILLFEAYRFTSVSAATLSYYFAPALVTLLSPLLFRERLTLRQGVCFAMSTAGLALILLTDGAGGGSDDRRGILLGLAAAAFYAAVILLNKAIRRVGGIHRTFLQFCAASVVLLPYSFLTAGCGLPGLDGTGWIWLLVVGAVHTGAAYCAWFTALRDLPGQTAAILSYIDPLTAVLISALLGERVTVWQLVGGALILGFTLWNEIGRRPEETAT